MMISSSPHRLSVMRRISVGMMTAASMAMFAAGVSATRASADDIAMRVYDSADADGAEGQRYFAASFGPIASEARPSGMDVVLVVDTSASQVGPFRKTTIAAVEACLASLHPQDRVELIAADLDAKLLTDRPAGPSSPEIMQALAELRSVTPLGASAMRETIEKAADQLASRSGDRRRAILYIGDGFGMSGSTLSGEWAATAHALRRDQMAVSCFAVGPQRNPALLASLANYTGGNLYIDDPGMATDDAEAARRGARVGRVLADWAHAEVVWPESTTANDAVLAAYPAQMPPIRSDRDTIVIGLLKRDATSLEVDALHGSETMAWSASVPASNDDNAYLATLVDGAARDAGLSLTTLGTAGLIETARYTVAETERLTKIAEQAVAMGDTTGAAKISQAVLKRDPGNLRAQTVQQSNTEEGLSLVRTAQLEVVEAAPVQPLATPTEVIADPNITDGAIVAPPADAYPAPSAPVYEDQGYYPPAGVVVDGRFLNSIERNRSVMAQLLEKEVQNAIADAREMMTRDPEQAIQSLKLMKQSIEQAPELVASVRAGLIDKLQSALRQADRASVTKDELDREAQENLAAAQEQRLLLDRMAQRRERMKQLVERLNALLDERRFAEASEVAIITEEIDPDGVVPRVAHIMTEHKRYHELNKELRRRRASAFLDTMWQVETSYIAFADNVPMVYPDAERWREITALREKYKAVDVAGESASEKAISQALTSPLPADGLDFGEGTPLEEVIEYLENEYEIEIVLDTVALDDEGVAADDPIAISVRNVSLRSALRQMLQPLNLTYVIDNEVLLITTEDEALNKLTVKVYPVADLVIPIPIAQPGGGAGLGGGGGGGIGGGGGGGLGGGGGGGLGGGGGGGGFGGGGGAFSVPDKSPRKLTIEADEPAAPVSPTTASTTSSTQASAPKTTKPAGADLWLPAPGAEAAHWDTVLASDQATPVAVRLATRRLMKQKRYDDTTNLISAAIRAGQQQAWMYESLGIAMQLGGAEVAEVERAVLSAVDLADGPDQLVAIADYLVGLGMDRRGVQVYRMALNRAPLLQEILGPALAAAKRSNDTESLRWATTAILERAWPRDLQPIADEADRVSKSLMARLEKGDNPRLAERYRNEVAEAQRRDCLVRVTWTGDADIDLSVKEPTGSVCWVGASRTSAGGIRLEGSASDADSNVHSETYVCPRGFAGDYEVLVEKVHGDVVADAVNIEITVAAGTEAETTQKQQVRLAENKAMAKFNNPVGRRAEPIEEQQLANALQRQEVVARSVIAQRVSSLADEGNVSLRPEERRRRRQALAGSGAVGFQPIIQTLQEGVQLGASAVVSADRRYVRVSPTPVFSVIGEIAQFSFSGAGADPSAQFAAAAGAAADPIGFGAGAGGAGGVGGGLGGGGLGGGLGGGGGGLGGGGGAGGGAF